MSDRLIIRRPDDWHVHLRDGQMLKDVVNYTARQFGRAIIMPNLTPPVTTVEMGRAYRDRILAAVSKDFNFEPLMVGYLTDDMSPDIVSQGKAEGVFTAFKLYPANATTNSSAGVTDIKKIYNVLERMSEVGMPLLVHGEVTHSDVDIFDREARFIEGVLGKVVSDFPNLKIVFEHITTSEAVDFVMAQGPNIGATITPHHLEINRNAIFQGGIRPHNYCLPIAKREIHRLALRKAAVSGSSKFFLGTDTAPHAVDAKESACGCAGIFNAPFAIESYAKTFAEEDALDKLEGFASEFGPRFYDLPLNEEKIILERSNVVVPDRLNLTETDIIPFHAGQPLEWRFVGLAK
jgi:dihydroorotase